MGCFKKGQRCGHGKLEKYNKNTNSFYLFFDGVWEEDKISQGTLSALDGTTIKFENGDLLGTKIINSPDRFQSTSKETAISFEDREKMAKIMNLEHNKIVPEDQIYHSKEESPIPKENNSAMKTANNLNAIFKSQNNEEEKQNLISPITLKESKVPKKPDEETISPVLRNTSELAKLSQETKETPENTKLTNQSKCVQMENSLIFPHASVKDYSLMVDLKIKTPNLELSIEDSIGLLAHCIRVGLVEASKAHEKDVIIFIGNTGAGKSTTINYLYGCTMELKSPKELGIKGFEDLITVKTPENGGKLEELMPIGHAKQSKTFMPQIEHDISNDLTYIDCPGFLDNRGPEINIANAVNIKNSIKQSKSVKVVMLINYHSLKADRGRGLSDMLKISSNLFGSSTNLVKNKNSILIGISATPHNTELEALKEWLIDGSPSEMQTLGERVFIFDPLDRNMNGGWTKNTIIQEIKKLISIKDHCTIFNTVLTDEDEKKLLVISDKISEKIMSYINKIDLSEEDFRLAAKQISYLKSLNIIEHNTIDRLIFKNESLLQRKLMDLSNEINFQCSLDNFEEAERIISILKKSITLFDKSTTQSCINLDKLTQNFNYFKERKAKNESKEREYQEKINSAHNKLEEVIKLLSDEKLKTQKQLEEQSLMFSKLIKDNQSNLSKELNKFDEERRKLEKDYEEKLRKKEDEKNIAINLTKKESQTINNEKAKLESELKAQRDFLEKQKEEYERNQKEILKKLQQKQEAEKIELEKKLKDYEGEMKAKEIELLLMKKGNQQGENKVNTSNEINLKRSNELYIQGMKHYQLGENGQTKEYAKALSLLKEAAELGNTMACCWVGEINEKGNGIAPNFTEAFRSFQKAANLGDAWGFSKLGQCYQEGNGVKLDFEKAKECYSKALEIGISDEEEEENIKNKLEEMENIDNKTSLQMNQPCVMMSPIKMRQPGMRQPGIQRNQPGMYNQAAFSMPMYSPPPNVAMRQPDIQIKQPGMYSQPFFSMPMCSPGLQWN